MTEFEQYFSAIVDGRIVACEKMKRIAEILLGRFAKPGCYHFDPDIAKRHTDFIERFCKLPSGRLGEPFRLELFQKARLQTVFGFVDDNGLRQYNEVLIVEGRKNGKTSECSAVELDLLINDGEGSPQIYNVATKADQAKLGFNACHKMVRLSPELRKYIRKRKSDLYFDLNMGYIMPLASNTNGLDGLDVHGAVIDELAAIKNRDLYDLIKQGSGARSQPLIFTITTNGFVREGIFDAQYEYAKRVLAAPDDPDNMHFLPFIYELDDVSEWTDESKWIKANPGLGTVKKYDYLRQMVAKAQQDPSFKPTVLVKDFDMPQTSESGWLTWEELYNEAKWDFPIDYGVGGFDAADSVDLNSAKALFMRPDDPHIYVKSMYWIPQRVLDEQAKSGDRRGRDEVPYDRWVELGYMRTYSGAKVDKRVFLDWFLELQDQGYYMRYIGYDPWHIDDSLLADFRAAFGKQSMIPIRQGPYTLSQPMKDLKADFREGLIVYNNNPIDRWCLYNTQIKTDVNGNWQPVKKTDVTQRIDGAISLLCGYVALKDHASDIINLN